eukprot:3923357-Pyramimonas_sp.AAC.2
MSAAAPPIGPHERSGASNEATWRCRLHATASLAGRSLCACARSRGDPEEIWRRSRTDLEQI